MSRWECEDFGELFSDGVFFPFPLSPFEWGCSQNMEASCFLYQLIVPKEVVLSGRRSRLLSAGGEHLIQVFLVVQMFGGSEDWVIASLLFTGFEERSARIVLTA